MVFQIFRDGILEFRDALECAASDTLSGDLGEEALDHVEPGRRGRCEVQMEARMFLEPTLHGRGLIGGMVVDNQMQIETGRGLLIDLRKRTNSRCRWRGMQVPITLPSSMLRPRTGSCSCATTLVEVERFTGTVPPVRAFVPPIAENTG
jgi:hypothetical protein